MKTRALALATTCSLIFASATALAGIGDDFFHPALVDAVSVDTLVPEATSAATSALPGVTGYWGDLVNADVVPEDGAGVYVAVIDTGLVPQAPFFFSQANIAYELGKGFTHDIYWDGALGDIVVGPLRDDRGIWTGLASGHGTHVASTVVGFNVNNSFWVNGIAPAATIIPVLALDAWLIEIPGFGKIPLSGGSDEMIAAAITYVAELAPTLDGPVVINLSLGGPGRVPMIEAAVDLAIANGVIVVAAAGNSGSDGMGYPGGLSQVISAGAGGWATMFYYGWGADVPEKLNSKDIVGNTRQVYLEDFSSRPNIALGQKTQDLDVTAPGAWIVGPYKNDFANDLNYYYVSGTSMASPHVAAIAALVLQSHPDTTQAEMEAIFEVAAAGGPLPASDATVLFPYVPGGFYTADWDGGDYGRGFLLADEALGVAGR
ncbi:MAG: hypothetical protein EP329_10985 [Deltaproteobacteria bacterium]|nr:MAG: hypothetical protein EP329_10985 [Deltaproteobacteria bacterium]